LRIQTARLPKKPNDSPHDLHFSHRVGRLARPSSCIHSRRNKRLTQAPLMRFFAPPALKADCVHSPSADTEVSAMKPPKRPHPPAPKCESSGAPSFTCPVCSARAVSHDLDGLLRNRPSRVSPDDAHGVCVLQGLSRFPEGRLVTEPAVPSCRSALAARRRICIRPPRSTTVDFRVSLRGATVTAHLRFPDDEGSFPSWTFL